METPIKGHTYGVSSVNGYLYVIRQGRLVPILSSKIYTTAGQDPMLYNRGGYNQGPYPLTTYTLSYDSGGYGQGLYSE